MKGIGRTKNDSGLILVVDYNIGRKKERILLPGDCKYKHIPKIQSLRLTGLIA